LQSEVKEAKAAKNDEIIAALIGSANFSRNGLCTDFRETLA